MPRITSRGYTSLRKVMEPHSMNASGVMEWNGLAAAPFSNSGRRPTRLSGWTWRWARRSGQELRNSYIITKSTEHAPLRRFFKAAVDAFTASIRPFPSDIRTAEVAAHTDAGDSG